jgi:hypothetical protein
MSYKRLPGKKKNLAGCYTLYQGADHLLLVYARFGLEDYRRFYFSDIQAISTYKTATGLVQNIIITIIGALFGFLLIPEGDVSATTGIIITAIFAVLLTINILRGPTCETTIKTAVQTEKLHPLNRLKRAHKVMDQIAPLIRRFQGELPPAALGNKPVRAEPARPAKPVKPAADSQPGKPGKYKGYAHLALFSLLVLDMVLVLMNTALHLTAVALVSSMVTLAIAISCIIALVRQTHGRISGPVRLLTWSTLGYVCVSWVVSYIHTISMFFDDPQALSNQWQMLESFAALTFFESPLVSVIHCLVVGSAIGIGLPGLILLNRSLKRKTPVAGSVVRKQTKLPAGSGPCKG